MKKMLIALSAIAFFTSCNNDKKADGATPEAKPAASTVTLPQKMSYEGDVAIGKSEDVATVMNFNTDFIAGNFDKFKTYFADSVNYTMADGSMFNSTGDSAISAMKAWRGMMTSAKQSYIAAMAVDNTTKGDHWVFQWIDEEHTYKDGKVEHQILHEDYLLVNGKIRTIYQYAQAVPAKK